MNQKSYDESHVLLAGIEIAAWLCVVSGIIMGFISIENREALLPASTWFAFGFSAVGLAAMCRVGRAIVDIAENTGRSAQLLARTTDNRTPSTRHHATPHPDEPRYEPPTTGGWPMGQIEIYRGHVVTGLQNRVFTNDRYFDSVEEARMHLNSIPSKRS